MHRSTLPAAAVLLLTCALTAGAAFGAGAPERALQRSWSSAELGAFRFDLSVAELEVVAGASGTVEVEIFAVCKSHRKDCAEWLEDLELSERRRGDTLMVELQGYPSWGKGRIEIEARLALPADLDFELDMGVGEVRIEGLRSSLDLELGVGEITIEAKSSHLRKVRLDVGVGEAEIYGAAKRIEGRRSFLVGSEVYWSQGQGSKRIDVDLGVGEVTVRLD